MLFIPLVFGAVAQSANPDFQIAPGPLLLRHPTVNKTSIVFKFADDLWEVPREGGSAVRLTSSPGVVGDPFFSPDGTMIAFSANYDGHQNVYVIPDRGGVPKRLTAHPAPETVVGWTPDSQDVVLSSSMLSNTDQPRLFKVSANGGYPTALPLPNGTEASYSPDGTHLAYVPIFRWETAWKRYRGGQAYKIFIADLADSRAKEIPRKNWNDNQPTWFGNKIYYLSDQKGPVGLYSYDVSSGSEKVEVPGVGFDLKSLTAGPDVLAYEKLGSIHLFNPATHADTTVKISVHGDFSQVRPEFKQLTPYIDSASLSPNGSRLAFAARGFVLTVPASKGDVHETDETQGVHRRDVEWSPDGKTIAYITDAGGYRQLGLWDLATSKERRIDVGEGPSLYAFPNWSPDSSKIVCMDYRGIAWLIDVKSGQHKKAIQWPFAGGPSEPSWSPDSKWLAYSDMLPSHYKVIKLYSLESGKSTQITDGFADAAAPVFDRGGKYLYFQASTHIGQAATLGDLSQYNNPNPVSSLYAVLLTRDLPNPLQPESDEESGAIAPAAPPAKAVAKAAAKGPSLELDGIENRIIALPTPTLVYQGLHGGAPGSFYALVSNPITGPDAESPLVTAYKFDWGSKKLNPAYPMITGFRTTPDGSKALIARGHQYYIVPTAAPVPMESGAVNLSGLVMKIDPKKEWDHILHEIWREAPLHFWSPITNGIDPKEMERRYQPFLQNLASRDDLGHLIDDMLGELCVGHEFPGGGDIPTGRQVSGGLLGADYDFTGGHYRITRIYDGERWNPELYAPLAQPGVNAKVGEYVLAIDGAPLTSSTDIYLSLENMAGKQVRVKLGPTPDGVGSREVTVIPVASEFGLRSRAWEEDNRRQVARETNGRAGYVHVPDTAAGGWVAFNRYYYAQAGKDGIVVDERFNHGGLFNDFMIHEMQKKLFAYFAPRYFEDEPTPAAGIYGPKVLMINEFAGSGGDMFPWLFRQAKIGPLIGKRTWGGLVAVQPIELADGGTYTAPDFAFYDHRAGKWDVENWGVSPDIDVDLDPYEWRQGRDSQLERSIAEINKMLANYKPEPHHRPEYPDRTKLDVRF
jgi:tricorn protease